MKKFHETHIESTFNVEALIALGHGKRLREHKPDSPCEKDGRIGVIYDFWQLIYVEDGSYHCQLEGYPASVLEKGQLLICEPGTIRFSIDSRTTVAGIISIRCRSPKMRLMKNRAFSLTDEEQNLLFSAFRKGEILMSHIPIEKRYGGLQVEESIADHQLQILKNYIELLLISLYDRCICTGKDSPALQNQQNYYEIKFRMIEGYMKANLHRNLSIDDILAYTSFSQSTLKRIFQNQAGCGIIHYFLKLKIGEAKRLLLETELTVTQISDQLGFSSIHHFSNTFKKFTGFPPGMYSKATMQQLP